MNQIISMNDEEISSCLNEFLEAERAGALVAEHIHKTHTHTPALTAFIGSVHQGETYWVAMLERHLQAMGHEPSQKVGAFYKKATAIADQFEQLTFLNRGQVWVVKKLKEFMPKLPDGSLKSDLEKMLLAHESNYTRLDGLLTKLQESSC